MITTRAEELQKLLAADTTSSWAYEGLDIDFTQIQTNPILANKMNIPAELQNRIIAISLTSEFRKLHKLVEHWTKTKEQGALMMLLWKLSKIAFMFPDSIEDPRWEAAAATLVTGIKHINPTITITEENITQIVYDLLVARVTHIERQQRNNHIIGDIKV